MAHVAANMVWYRIYSVRLAARITAPGGGEICFILMLDAEILTFI